MPFDSIWNWLIENHPDIFWFSIILLLIIIAVWKISKFHDECKNCREVCHNKTGIAKDISRLNEKINTILTILTEKEIIKSDLFSSNSPLNLTPKGHNLIKEIGWDKILEDGKSQSELFGALDKINLKSKADVEKYCTILLHELNSKRDTNLFTSIKKYLYENSSVSEMDAIFACSLHLRNKYLEKRPAIKE
ncbi:MAG: hypothetical protein ACD_7C00298G0002 [uncultured bacterium]|nr:MAG: hypothetical protein ACD_7C00298G0002 [uncultured bacterium]HBR78964.1 hypothetical protein [Candidatus Moranbacteria bacterium]